MPVKVRCPGCKKVLNAPDASRGKSVRCPNCRGAVRIPKRKPQPAAKVAGSDDDFIGSLNLNEVVDRSVLVCPACGVTADPEAEDCGSCGVNLRTGRLSEREKKRRERKGPDRELFYKDLWRDPWEFSKEHWSLTIRSGLYMLLMFVALGAAVFMVNYCDSAPPRVFWTGILLLFSAVIPGWFSFMSGEIIRTTLKRKSRDLGRIHFDIFQCFTSGMDFYFVAGIILSPVIMGAAFAYRSNHTTAAVIAGIGVFLALPITPLAMSHLAMPDAWKAWFAPALLPTFFRHLGPSLMFVITFFVTLIPVTFTWVPAFFFWRGFYKSLLPTSWITDNLVSQAKNMDGVAILTLMGAGLVIATLVIIYYILTVGLVTFTIGFSGVFNSRVIGLFAYYHQRDLGLIRDISERDDKIQDGFNLRASTVFCLKFLTLGIVTGNLYAVVDPTIGYPLGTGIGTFLTGSMLLLFGAMMMLGQKEVTPLYKILMVLPWVSLFLFREQLNIALSICVMIDIFVGILHWRSTKWAFFFLAVGAVLAGIGQWTGAWEALVELFWNVPVDLE